VVMTARNRPVHIGRFELPPRVCSLKGPEEEELRLLNIPPPPLFPPPQETYLDTMGEPAPTGRAWPPIRLSCGPQARQSRACCTNTGQPATARGLGFGGLEKKRMRFAKFQISEAYGESNSYGTMALLKKSSVCVFRG